MFKKLNKWLHIETENPLNEQINIERMLKASKAKLHSQNLQITRGYIHIVDTPAGINEDAKTGAADTTQCCGAPAGWARVWC